MTERSNPLFFRADGGLDLGQFFLGVLILWVCLVFTLTGFGMLAYPTAAWAFLGSFTTLFFIAFAAERRADLIAKSKTPSEVAQGIAASEPSLWVDDETADGEAVRDYRDGKRA